jgi:hypothetical protein
MYRFVRRFGILAALSCAVFVSQGAPVQGQFASGNLVVLRVGDGSAALTAAGTAIFLDQFNTSSIGQAPSYTLALPTVSGATTRIVNAGSSGSEGQISFNSATSTVAIPGYDAAVGTAAIAGTASATTNRVVLGVNLTGNSGNGSTSQLATLSGTGSSFSAGNIRGAYSNGTNTWAVGSNTGVVVTPPETTIVSAAPTNNRVINSFNGNLYMSTGSGATRGIYQIGTSGLPTGTTTSTSFINTGGTSSNYGFAINAAGDVAYIADDSAIASGGGIQKWTFNGTVWSLAGTFQSLSGTETVRGLSVDFSGANPVLYATTNLASANKLISLVDTGNFATTATILATAPANEAFRGVVFFTPVPEPTTILGITALSIGLVGGLRRRFAKKA